MRAAAPSSTRSVIAGSMQVAPGPVTYRLVLSPPERSNFYERLREVRDFHKRFPSAEMTEAEDDSALLKDEPHVEFTGENAREGRVGIGSWQEWSAPWERLRVGLMRRSQAALRQ